MAEHRSKRPGDTEDNPKLHKTILEDLRKGGFKRSIRQDLKNITDFYIDRKTRERLRGMGRIRRGFHLWFWLLKSLILKLNPTRRLLLVLSLFFAFFFVQVRTGNLFINSGLLFFGYLILLLILMLELKDKLLAQDELAAGRRVQFALMPDENPDFSGWDIWLFTRPANEVGGDLVDYLVIDDDRMHLVIGDVAGKGLGAALLMARLQATFRAFAPNFETVSKIGNEMNRLFCRDGLPSRFVSLVYLELRAGQDKIRLINAGHLPPLMIHGGEVQELPHGQTALGLTRDQLYEEHTVRLTPGDCLIVYSDGLTEARNSLGHFFGDNRLKNLCLQLHGYPAGKMGHGLIDSVDRFAGEARQNDDLSIIILKRSA